MSPAHRPGPPGLLLRALSVIPFVLTGAVGVIAFVSWLAVIMFGWGTGRGAVWSWASGKPAGEVIVQVGLALLIGVACLAVVALSIYATNYGFSSRQPRHFWLIAQTVFSGLAILLVVAETSAPEALEAIGLTGADWYFVLGLVAFAMIVVGMRMRRAGDDDGDGRDAAGGARDGDDDMGDTDGDDG